MRNMMTKTFLFLPALCLAVCLLGCSKLEPMSGTVTFEDGKPLTTGTVIFQTNGFQAKGTLDAQGKYKIGSDKPGNGLPSGKYEVGIAGAEVQVSTKGGGESFESKPLIKEKYSDPSTSGITVTVDGKTKTFDFKVEKP